MTRFRGRQKGEFKPGAGADVISLAMTQRQGKRRVPLLSCSGETCLLPIPAASGYTFNAQSIDQFPIHGLTQPEHQLGKKQAMRPFQRHENQAF